MLETTELATEPRAPEALPSLGRYGDGDSLKNWALFWGSPLAIFLF